MGDWFRNNPVKAVGVVMAGRAEGGHYRRSQNTTAETYADLGVDKRDAFRLQRLWDWEQETGAIPSAVERITMAVAIADGHTASVTNYWWVSLVLIFLSPE